MRIVSHCDNFIAYGDSGSQHLVLLKSKSDSSFPIIQTLYFLWNFCKCNKFRHYNIWKTSQYHHKDKWFTYTPLANVIFVMFCINSRSLHGSALYSTLFKTLFFKTLFSTLFFSAKDQSILCSQEIKAQTFYWSPWEKSDKNVKNSFHYDCVWSHCDCTRVNWRRRLCLITNIDEKRALTKNKQNVGKGTIVVTWYQVLQMFMELTIGLRFKLFRRVGKKIMINGFG